MKLKIELKLEDNTVSGRVLEQDESLRSLKNEAVKTLIKNDNFEIRSSTCPQLFFDTLWVRGEQQLADNISFVESYDNPEDANKVYATIVELVNELNGELGGVVDERGNTLFVKDDAIGIIHHQEDRGADKDQSAKADKGKLELSLVNPELVKAVAEESGLSHLAHMACNISFLLDEEYLKEHKGDMDIKDHIQRVMDFKLTKPIDLSKVEKDTLIEVSDDEITWHRRYFAKYKDGKVCVYSDGCTSKTATAIIPWKFARLAEED